MAEESKQAFDPDATVAQPLAGADPEATVRLPPGEADPDATLTGPLAKIADPEATDLRAGFDPDATVNPVERTKLDPEATVRAVHALKPRSNPFAPRSLPESIQANLASLGGVNPLVAMANPILAAVPQIRRSLKHPDAAGLKASLRDQIESFEMSAASAEVSDETVSAAVYALCALLDESAAATPWGTDWTGNGLLHALRGEAGGADGFFAVLDKFAADPDKHAELLEFLYICLALGFEGRYRDAAGGRAALDEINERLYTQIARRRPRPEGLSEHWRTPAAQAAADAALATAARATAARAAADAAAREAAERTAPLAAVPRFALSRLPRRAIWGAVAGLVGAALAFYMLGLRLLEDQTQSALSAKPNVRIKTAAAPAAPASAPAAGSASAALSAALAGLPVTITESAGRVTLAPREERQFGAGGTQPAAPLRALLPAIAAALDKLPGAIVVVGHADASPSGARYASNTELSAARARAVARLMAPALADPKRLAAEGRGDAEPAAPNDSAANRAKNRRIAIVLKAAP
jgi:type VI secretion system protein ImpK